MSERDQNSPNNKRDFEEGESQEHIDAENGSAPEDVRNTAAEGFPADSSGGEIDGENVSDATSGDASLPENESGPAGTEPEAGSFPDGGEPGGGTIHEEVCEDAGKEVFPDVPVEEGSELRVETENGEGSAGVNGSEGETSQTISDSEASPDDAGSSLEGMEITGSGEAEGSEESLQREEVVDDLAHIIESIVFASDEPLPVSTIKIVLDAARTFGRVNPDMITGRINALNAKYDKDGTGFCIVEIANGYQYATRKEMAQWVSNLFKERSKRRLSNSALETVAIIAYKQPITKPEIESIRGVSVDYVLHNLLEKELVTVVGRAESVGRPLLYGTTQKFLKIFALKNLEDLPKLREIDEIIKEIKSKGAEESIQLEITALGDSSAPEQENKPGEPSQNGAE